MDNPYKETFETFNKVVQLYQDKFMKFDLYNDTFCGEVNTENARIVEIECRPENITKYFPN